MNRRVRCAFAAVGVAWLLQACAVPTALAQSAGPTSDEAGIELGWYAPSGCPQEEQVLAEVVDLLGERSDRPLTGRISVQAYVEREGRPGEKRWLLELRISGAVSGRRTLRGDSCEALAETAAVLIALVIEPELATGAEVLPPAVEEEGQGDRERGEPDEEQADTDEDTSIDRGDEEGFFDSVRLRLEAGANVLADLGALPQPAVGVGGLVALNLDRVRAALFAHYVFPNSTGISGYQTVRVSFELIETGLQVCYRAPLADSGVGLGPCGEVSLGVMKGESTGVQDEARNSSFWLALGPGVHLDWRFSERFGPYGEVGALFPLRRPGWLLHDLGPAHRSEPMVLRILLGAFLLL